MIRKLLILTFVFVVGIYFQLRAIENEFQFRHLTVEEGLSNSNVNCIVQDSNGFIWIGTENGLNRYDGYEFTHYFSNINQENSLYSNEILSLLVDSYGDLYIGTFQGLFKYNAHLNNFEHISFGGNDKIIVNIPVYALLEDGDSLLWIGTSGRGLLRYNKNEKKIKAFAHDALNNNTISSNYIQTLFKDADQNIWVGTVGKGLDVYNKSTHKFENYQPQSWSDNPKNAYAILDLFAHDNNQMIVGTRGGGLYLFDKQNKTFESYTIPLKKASIVQPKEIYSIYRDSKQRMWISSHGDGLYYFEKNDKALQLNHEPENSSSLINNNTRTIFEDVMGNLWIASYQGGINIIPNVHKRFYTLNMGGEAKSTSNTITAICSDNNRYFWVGTDGGGLRYLDRTKKKVLSEYKGYSLTDIAEDKVVLGLLLDGDELWIGTYLKGITKFNLKSGKKAHYEKSNDAKSLSNNFVSCIIKTTNNDIYVGTNGGGINKYNKETNDFVHIGFDALNKRENLVDDYVTDIAEDNNGRLWICTFWGLSVFDPLNGMFNNYLQNENNGLSNNTIYCIKITSNNEVWLGTRNGLNRFNPSNNTFKSFNLAEGLAGNVIYSIEEDAKGQLWLSTNNGLCNFNPQTFETRNYFKSDGFLSNEFFRNASFQSKKGEMFFGSLEGLVSFFPDSLNGDYTIPKVSITKFSIFNQEILPGKKLANDLILTQPIYLTQQIELKHKYNSFAFEFSALDYTMPEKIMYKYKMEGFDRNWQTLKHDQRYVTYTNLDAGSYIFKVKASSIDNKWDDQTTNVVMVIKPAFYNTWWAFIIYYMLLVGFVLLLWYVSMKRVKLTNAIKLERVERDKADEINQAKLQFFTNISHELRTPLTLIIGPIEKMLADKTVYKKYGESVALIQKNTDRLLRLVNQIMDLRKIENGKMKLKIEQSDIIVFLKDIHSSFNDLAERKNINFRFLASNETKICWFDADKLDKIVFNLLSNAFKFTNSEGEITLFIDEITNEKGVRSLSISIKDSGIGIPAKDLIHIFDRFYQSADTSQSYNMGSGVGLSLTKSLVEQHHGNISVNSVKNEGTEFIVTLPLNENVYADDEKISGKVHPVNKYTNSLPDIASENNSIGLNDKDKHHTLLVVEDNYDLRTYIVNELKPWYHVLEAENGKEALDIVLKHLPDVVISDIVMPEMDGLELCRKIKDNFICNHIPVILLTARASIEHRIVGINQGADSYIPKPFNPDHLKIRVKKLLELRSVLKQKYAKELNLTDEPVVVEEDAYLKEIKHLIMQNIDDPELNIDRIGKELNISRAHLYRKIKVLTDKSPTEFVRIIRLNEAAKILLNTTKSISEVCYMVGFNSPSYFSICFKDHFKISPIDYVKKNKNKPV